MTRVPFGETGLDGVSVGVVPIVWNNVDLAKDATLVPPETVLDEIGRLGYDGCQFGLGFPSGNALRSLLAARSLRLAEVYVTLPLASADDARSRAREALDRLSSAGGDVLVAALVGDGPDGRDEWSGRAASPEAPRLHAEAWRSLAALLEDIGREALDRGHRLAFHPHTGTYVETPAEVERLADATNPDLVGICLDTGHYTVGGGDPVAALRAMGERVRHLHLKDVDPAVLGRLRSGQLHGFGAAIRERIFTELGSGMLDLDGVLAELAARRYRGWLMVEQDTTWLPPSEAAAIGRRVLAYATRRLGIPAAA
jgi:inosose dehydratase